MIWRVADRRENFVTLEAKARPKTAEFMSDLKLRPLESRTLFWVEGA